MIVSIHDLKDLQKRFEMAKISCAFNQDVDEEGVCKARTCMVRTTKLLTDEQIKNCREYKNIPRGFLKK